MITAPIIALSLLACLWAPLQYVLAAVAAYGLTRLVVTRPRVPFPGYTLSAAAFMLAPSITHGNAYWLFVAALWLIAVSNCPWGSPMSAVMRSVRFDTKYQVELYLHELGFNRILGRWMRGSQFATITHLPASDRWLVEIGVPT